MEVGLPTFMPTPDEPIMLQEYGMKMPHGIFIGNLIARSCSRSRRFRSHSLHLPVLLIKVRFKIGQGLKIDICIRV